MPTKIGNSDKFIIKTACCTLSINVTFNEKNEPIHVRVGREGNSGGCVANIACIEEFCNDYLERGDVIKLLKILHSHHCPSCIKQREKLKVESDKLKYPKSCSDAICKAIKFICKEQTKDKEKEIPTNEEEKKTTQDNKPPLSSNDRH